MQNGGRGLSGGGSLQNVYSERELTKLLKAAPTNFASFMKLVKAVRFLSDKDQTSCLDVFLHHLRGPVERRRCESQLSLRWILNSLFGICDLTHSYFDHGPAHKQRFIKCWPRIIEWLRTTFDGRHFLDNPDAFFSMTAQHFSFARSVYAEALEKDDAFELAVDLWNGFTTKDGRDSFSASSLLVCLSRQGKGNTQARRDFIMKNGPEWQVNKFLSRLKQAVFHSPKLDVDAIVMLVFLMDTIERLGQKPKSMAIFSPNAGPCLVRIFSAVLNVANPSKDHMGAASFFCTVIHRCMKLGSLWTRLVIEAGFLEPLLKLASAVGDNVDPCETKPRFSPPSDILTDLHRYLTSDDVVAACRKGLCDLHAANSESNYLPEALEASLKFRDMWKAFETTVLEQAALRRLFRAGYATEVGRCASAACRKLELRLEFKKCAGCAFALYCSRSCQKEDWPRHRNGCKKVDQSSFDIVANEVHRFPRKVAELQINRHSGRILGLARNKNIPPGDLAFRIVYDKFPFRIEVFDYHELLDDTKHPPHLVLLANEFQRRLLKTEQPLCYPLVLRMGNTEVPSYVYLLDTWLKEIPTAPCGPDGEGATYCDQDGKALSFGTVDALRAAVRFAHRYAKDLGKTVWSKDILDKATETVMREFS